MQVRNLGCRRASGFIGTSAVCHVPLPDEFLHHRPKTADSRPINKLVVVADAADPPVRDWTGADAGGPKPGRSQRCHTPEKSGVDAMASAPLSPAAGVTVCARAGAVPVANLSPTLCRNAVLRSTGRPCLRSRSAKASSANSWAMSSPEPEGLAGAFSGWKGGFPIVRASFRLARASADAYRRLLTRRADLNQQGWAAIDSPAASRIRIANRGHRRGRQFAGKPSHCKRNRRHFPNTMTCHLACWQLDANQLSSGGDAKIHQAAERDKRLKCQ